MQEQHPCYYPGEFAPPTKMHLNALYWLLNRPEVSHVNVVVGKTNGPISQDQKARMWEMMLKSHFSPQATIIKAKENGPLTEVYSLFELKPDKPAYIALDEKSATNKKLQKKFSKFPFYGMQLLPSQFYKSSAALHQAAKDNDIQAAKEQLPDDFSDEQVNEYLSILNENVQHDEPLVDKSPLLKSYSEQYKEMFNDGFWKSVFEPMAESLELNEAISDSAKKKALEKFKKENPEAQDASIMYYINKFSEKQSSNVFQKKDIFQYKFDELEKIIDANFPSDVSVKTADDDVDFKGSEDVIYNENGLLILLGDLKEKCIRYGKGYSWCISRPDRANMFFSYRMRLNEPVFYFVFDEDKPKNDIYHAIVIYINKDGDYYVATSNNLGDEEMSWSEIEEKQPKLKGLQKLFKHIPLTAEERKDYEMFKKEISDEKYDKLNFTEKEKYIGFGHDLTEKQIRATPKELVSKYVTTSYGRNLPEDIEKTLSPSDKKKLKDNREKYIEDNVKSNRITLDDFKYATEEQKIKHIDFRVRYGLLTPTDANNNEDFSKYATEQQITDNIHGKLIQSRSVTEDELVRGADDIFNDREKTDLLNRKWSIDIREFYIKYGTLGYHFINFDKYIDKMNGIQKTKLLDNRKQADSGFTDGEIELAKEMGRKDIQRKEPKNPFPLPKFSSSKKRKRIPYTNKN